MKKKLLVLIPALLLSVTACNITIDDIKSIINELSMGEGDTSQDVESKQESAQSEESKPADPASSSKQENSSSASNPTSSSSGKTSESSSTPSTPVAKKKHPWFTEDQAVTIRWDNTFSYDSAIETLINDFKKLEPYITVDSNKKSGGYDLLESDTLTGFSADNYANIVTCYPDHVANYIDYGKAVNFDKYLYGEYGYTDDELDDFVESYLNEGRTFFDEGTYVMPQSKSTEPMYYNAKILGKVIPGINNGKAIDESYINHLTWEELFDNFCPKFIEWNKTNKLINLDSSTWDKYKFGGVIGYDSDDNFFITMCEQLGIPYTSFDKKTGYGSADFNNPEAKAMVKRIKDAYDKGYIFTKGTCDSFTNYGFTANQCLFTVGSTGGLKYQVCDDFETKVAMIPQSKNGKKDAMISQGPGVCILTHGNENEDLAAWAFIKFLNEPENTKYWASETGYAPTRYSVYEDDEYLELCDPSNADGNEAKLKAKILSLYDQVKDYLFVNPAFKGSSAVRKQVGGLMTNALLDKDDHFSKGTYDAWLDELFATALNAAKKEMF